MILNIQLKGTSVNQHCMYKVTLPTGKSHSVADTKAVVYQYIRNVQSRSETHNLSYILNLLDVELNEIDLFYHRSMLNDHDMLEKSLSVINDMNQIAKKDEIILLLACRNKRYSIDIKVINPPMIERSIDSIDHDFIISISLTGDNIYKINTVADLMGEIYDTRNSNVKKHYDIYHQCLTFNDQLVPPDLSIKELCKMIEHEPLVLKLNEFSLSHIITKHFKTIGSLKQFDDLSELQSVFRYIESMLTKYGICTSSAKTITFTKCTSYTMVSIVLILFFTIAIILYVGTVKPYYIVRVSNCADDGDESSYLYNDWTLSLSHAFCPINSLDHCKRFEDSSTWKTIDAENYAAGYASHLELGAEEWNSSFKTIRFSYVALFIVEIFAGVLILHSSNVIDSSRWKINTFIQYAMIIAIFIVHIGVFFTLVGGMLMLNNSDQHVALSWSTVIFDTCSVEVVKSEGFELCKYCATICGLFLLISLASITFYVYNRCVECENETITTSTDECDMRLSDVGNSPLHKQPSLSRQASTIIMTVNPALHKV